MKDAEILQIIYYHKIKNFFLKKKASVLLKNCEKSTNMASKCNLFSYFATKFCNERFILNFNQKKNSKKNKNRRNLLPPFCIYFLNTLFMKKLDLMITYFKTAYNKYEIIGLLLLTIIGIFIFISACNTENTNAFEDREKNIEKQQLLSNKTFSVIELYNK